MKLLGVGFLVSHANMMNMMNIMNEVSDATWGDKTISTPYHW